MENNNSPKDYKIIFTEDKYPVIYEILKKYGLDQLDAKALENLDKKNPISPPSIVILNAVTDLVEGTLKTNDVPGLLKDSLGLSDKNASSLSEDIKARLVTICKKVTKENLEKEEKIAKPTSEIHDDKTSKKINENTASERPNKRKGNIGKQPVITEMQNIKKPAREGPDNYREPIE